MYVPALVKFEFLIGQSLDELFVQLGAILLSWILPLVKRIDNLNLIHEDGS